MAEMMSINVIIGDRTYRIKIDPKDEQTVRGAVKVISDKVVEYKQEFAGKDMQDYIAMVLLWFATRQIEQPDGNFQAAALETKLRALNSALDKALANS